MNQRTEATALIGGSIAALQVDHCSADALVHAQLQALAACNLHPASNARPTAHSLAQTYGAVTLLASA